MTFFVFDEFFAFGFPPVRHPGNLHEGLLVDAGQVTGPEKVHVVTGLHTFLDFLEMN